jgi:hypothetical protein
MPPRARTDSDKPRSVSGAEARRQLGEREHEEISVTLAHPLPEGNDFTDGGEAANVGDPVKVKRHQARHLIAAGYAQVDPEDAAQVAAALAGGPDDPVDENKTPAPGSGSGSGSGGS